jgi:hypothetical protein
LQLQGSLYCDTFRSEPDHAVTARLKPDAAAINPELLFTENETNGERLYGYANGARYAKDAFHRYIVNGDRAAVNPEQRGTKAAARYAIELAPGSRVTLRLRLNDQLPGARPAFGTAFNDLFDVRKREADEFYESVLPAGLSDDAKLVGRQAFAGLLWSKQYYHYVGL